MRKRVSLLFAAALVLAVGIATPAAQPSHGVLGRFGGAVYTMSNAAAGNAIFTFDRLFDGRLVPQGSTPTGGNGTGGGLGNQGGLILTRNERWLLAVNAGSNSISVLRVHHRGLQLTDVKPSGGVRPISITEYRGLVYVLNAGNDTISGFRLQRDGKLEALASSTRPLSGTGTDPAQISFTPDGDVLVVTEKATNNIVTFELDGNGLPAAALVQPSIGQTPFGFAFGKRDQLIVSEAFGGAANASAASSYEVDHDGVLTPLGKSVGTKQTALCWIAITPNGRFAYGTNTGSGSISGYAIDFDGGLMLLNADGRTGVTGDGSAPIDLVITDNGRYLYSLNSGSNSIGAFRVEANGALTRLPFFSGLPAGTNGLAAR